MDKFKIYYHKDTQGGIYELRVWDGNRWSSSYWEPTLREAKAHAYRMYAQETLFEVVPSIATTEGSAELKWTGKDLTEFVG